MTDDRTAAGEPRAAHGLGGKVLAVTTSVQTVVQLSLIVPVSVAPAVAISLGIPPWYAGYHITIAYMATTLFSAFAGAAVHRFGACRMSQICLLFSVAGSLLISASSVPLFACGSAMIGIALALTNTTGAHLLARFTDPQRRNLVFSINKTGVPLGGVLAGLIGPGIAAVAGWHWAPLVPAAIALLLVLAIQPMRTRLDDDRTSTFRVEHAGFGGLALIFKTDRLRWLTIGGLGLEVAQLAFIAYLVTALNQELGFSLLAAGYVLSAAQVAGVFGRLFWGWAADRIGDGLALLVALSLWSVLTFGAISLASIDGPPFGVGTLFVLTAIAVMGWFGVYLAEVARLSPPGMVATVTGANLAVITIAAFGGPSLFALFYTLTNSYTTCFGLLAVACAFSALTVQKTRRVVAAEAAKAGAP